LEKKGTLILRAKSTVYPTTQHHMLRPESSCLGVVFDCQTLYAAPLTPPYSYRTPDCDVSNMFHLLITSAADDGGRNRLWN